jgi:hypothetical protein
MYDGTYDPATDENADDTYNPVTDQTEIPVNNEAPNTRLLPQGEPSEFERISFLLKQAMRENAKKGIFSIGIATLSVMMYITLTADDPILVTASSAIVNVILNTGGAANSWAHFFNIYKDVNKGAGFSWRKIAEIAFKFGLVGGSIAFGFGLIGAETTKKESAGTIAFSVFANAISTAVLCGLAVDDLQKAGASIQRFLQSLGSVLIADQQKAAAFFRSIAADLDYCPSTALVDELQRTFASLTRIGSGRLVALDILKDYDFSAQRQESGSRATDESSRNIRQLLEIIFRYVNALNETKTRIAPYYEAVIQKPLATSLLTALHLTLSAVLLYWLTVGNMGYLCLSWLAFYHQISENSYLDYIGMIVTMSLFLVMNLIAAFKLPKMIGSFIEQFIKYGRFGNSVKVGGSICYGLTLALIPVIALIGSLSGASSGNAYQDFCLPSNLQDPDDTSPGYPLGTPMFDSHQFTGLFARSSVLSAIQLSAVVFNCFYTFLVSRSAMQSLIKLLIKKNDPDQDVFTTQELAQALRLFADSIPTRKAGTVMSSIFDDLPQGSALRERLEQQGVLIPQNSDTVELHSLLQVNVDVNDGDRDRDRGPVYGL